MQNTGRKLGLIPADDEDYYYDQTEEPIADVTPIHAPRARGHLTVAEQTHRIVTAHPRNWDDAKMIGTTFREAVPVIMNLSQVNDADAQRLVDFAAGLALAMRGRLERITKQVFLLSPASLDVSEVAAEPGRRFEND
ncbi:MAG: cell division protein SepF [Bifidobacteriaceae bacterium]|nr:cell division protein SepF [Bifidobacteriaceae bacterium]